MWRLIVALGLLAAVGAPAEAVCTSSKRVSGQVTYNSSVKINVSNLPQRYPQKLWIGRSPGRELRLAEKVW